MASVLQTRDFFGSRFRCLALTGLPQGEASALLAKIANGHARVPASGHWMPQGPRKPNEAKLGELPFLLSDDQRREITAWWLAHPAGANTPNWDIVSECVIDGRDGLMLVEAKAHRGELHCGGKPDDPNASSRSKANHERIGDAITGANAGLASASHLDGWNISRDSHYQLANRFAWSWKLASLKIPVVLVYLGFLNANDMDKVSGNLFAAPEEWSECVLDHARGIVPELAWNQAIDVGGTPLYASIHSLEMTFR